MRPNQPHHALAGDAERKRDPRLRGDDPEADLRHLRGDALLVAFRQVAGDDRPENGVEARLQLLRKRGDLLGDIIARSDEQTSELNSLMQTTDTVRVLLKHNTK